MRGIIIDINKDRAVFLKKNGEITEIENKNYIIGQEVNLNNAVPFKGFMLVAACFLFCCITFFGGYATYNTAASYVYIDINPSIRIDINCFNRIIDVVPLNEDAENLLLTHKFKNTGVKECIDQIVALCRENNYFKDENNIEIDFATENKGLNTLIGDTCKNLQEKEYAVESLKINKEENSKAIKLKASPKRLKAIEKYTEAFGGTVEENIVVLKGVKVKDINDRIEHSFNNENDNIKEEPEKLPESDKRLEAITAYTEVFGGSVEENTALLKDLSVKEINEKTESSAKKPSEKENDKEARLPESDKRLEAITAYTEVFGGSVEENTALLKDLSVKEINEKTESSTKKPSEKENDKEVRLPESDERLEAIADYTEVFGGSVEENTVLLKELSVKAIKKLTEEKSAQYKGGVKN